MLLISGSCLQSRGQEMLEGDVLRLILFQVAYEFLREPVMRFSRFLSYIGLCKWSVALSTYRKCDETTFPDDFL